MAGSPSRRQFLRSACGLTAAALAARRLGAQPTADAPTTLPALASRPSTARIGLESKSLVAHLRAAEIIDGQKIHELLLMEMIEEGILLATGAADPGEAWNRLIKPSEVVAIKFNHVGEDVLASTVPMVRQIVASLTRADVAPRRIILIEAPEHPEVRALDTRKPVFGFAGEEVDFGSGREQLAAVLQEADALINVPFLKTHNIAGMTGCLKNLSHALIRRPQRYHAGGCAPFVGDIVNLPQIRDKLRINIVNAIRAVFEGGPAARMETTWAHGGLLISTDPVAADYIGSTLLDDRRAASSLPPVTDAAGHIPHIHAAARLGLGTDDQDYIELAEPRVG